MEYTRREFLQSVSAAAAVAGTTSAPLDARQNDDPLGVRRDFPVVQQGTYLNSPYITPSPVQALPCALVLLPHRVRVRIFPLRQERLL